MSLWGVVVVVVVVVVWEMSYSWTTARLHVPLLVRLMELMNSTTWTTTLLPPPSFILKDSGRLLRYSYGLLIPVTIESKLG